LTDITVNYSRPRVTLNGTDRTGGIWGRQIPFGVTKTNFGGKGLIPWRAGANENTTIHLTDDVKVEGKDLAAGKYSIHMIIKDANNATVIFNKKTTSWGSFWYDEKDDVLRVDVAMKDIAQTEVLTYSFPDMGNNYAVLALSWEKKQISFKIEVDVHKYILANFRRELQNLPGFGWQGPLSAARYCLNNNINNEEAIAWATAAVAGQKNFNTQSVLAGLMFQGGKQAEGDAVLDEAVKTATRPQINALGYQMIGQKRYQKAIQMLALNTVSDPTDANAFDSLGEAYKLAGDKPNAVKNLRKALSLNPAANVKANSEKLLTELGEAIK
jgi:tetratricopeptide (TPR) repeat protein